MNEAHEQHLDTSSRKASLASSPHGLLQGDSRPAASCGWLRLVDTKAVPPAFRAEVGQGNGGRKYGKTGDTGAHSKETATMIRQLDTISHNGGQF